MGPADSDPEGGSEGHDAWLSLGEASRLLGISLGTLRRWADRGQVPSFTTPGGHRRFPRSAIVALLPTGRARRPQLAELGASSERMAGAFRQLLAEAHGAGPLISQFSQADRDHSRELGRRMMEHLVAHLDAGEPAPAVASLHQAAEDASQYGAMAARLGATLGEGVETFLRFRQPFIDRLATTARKRHLDTREATQLLVDAGSAFDELLLAFVEGWQQET